MNPPLVPIIDAMVTLIAFLLYTTSFIAFVSVESPFPEASSHDVAQRVKEKPLQLTVSIREKDTEIWSPFDRIRPKILPNPVPGQPDLKGVHEALLGIKKLFPQEDKVVIAPVAGITYDNLVAVMDAMRLIEKSDPPLYRKNLKTGVDEAIKALFPEVIFGNLLGDS